MSTLRSLPLLSVPPSWPLPVVAVLAMGVLAGLDLLGAVAAKHWAEDGSRWAVAGGLVTFVALFWVYASSLRYAELAIVTMGWIVLLQVGILVVDRLHFGVALPTGKLVAIVIALAAEGYLVLGPGGT